MAEKIVNALIEGGKATAGPPLGPTLAPMGLNIGKVVGDINAATKEFAGTRVPVKVIVDTAAKSYTIEVGTPPTSALIKNAIFIQKGSGKAALVKAGDIAVDQLIKILKTKRNVIHGRSDRAALKEVIGSCIPMGILVDGKDPREMQKEVDTGKFDDKLSGKIELEIPSKEDVMKKNKQHIDAITQLGAATKEGEEAGKKKKVKGTTEIQEAAAAPATATNAKGGKGGKGAKKK
ncbi:MAG: 50S ribosomal protein L11 [DPANN group archaeon]|nr:50S ribosomal protein L11 [DPANN group archaeon]